MQIPPRPADRQRVSELFDRAGSLREAYAKVDWSRTPFGPVESWSPTLRSAVDLTLSTRFAVTLMWGPQFGMIYNEAYAPMIGQKHPAALGSTVEQVFPEAWDVIGPMLQGVLADGDATWTEDLRLPLHRRGFLEECFFTFSYSPVRNPDGVIEGCIDIAAESTAQIHDRRRLALLARLTGELVGAQTRDQVAQRALAVLADAGEDVLAAAVVPLELTDPDRPAPDVALGRTAAGTTAWLRMSGPEPVALELRLSPMLALDETYLDFVGLIGATVRQALDRIAVEQAEQRAAHLERTMSETLQRSLLGLPTTSPHLDLAVRYRPALDYARVGGDWYDSFELADGSTVLVVGDVAGHDQQAIAAMAQARNLLRGVSYTLGPCPPSRVLAALDEAMRGFELATHATAVLACVGADGAVEWSNAGHPPPALVAPDGRARLLETDPEIVLGVRVGARRTDHRLHLERGSTLVLYTDGLVERRGSIIDDGFEQLRTALDGTHTRTADEVCELLLERFEAGAEDDVALVVLRAPA